jgi:hypothetical protein
MIIVRSKIPKLFDQNDFNYIKGNYKLRHGALAGQKSYSPLFHHSDDFSVTRGNITRKVVEYSPDSTSIFPPIRLTNRVVI